MLVSEYVNTDGTFECVWFSCVGITLLLSMTVFQLIIADKVPESSQAVPIVGMTILVIINTDNIDYRYC